MLFQQLQHYRSININNANKILLFIDIPNSPQVENKQTSVIMTSQMWNWNINLVIIQYKTTWKPIQTNIQPLAATFAIVFKVPHQWLVGSFSYSFRNFCICFYAPLASFVYINRRHGERGQVKAERKSRRLLSCRLSLLPAGSPQKFMPHRPERSSPQTKLVRTWLTGELPARLCRPAGSRRAPCFSASPSLSVRLIGGAIKGGQKKTVNRAYVCLFTAIFTAIAYAHDICDSRVDLNVNHALQTQ